LGGHILASLTTVTVSSKTLVDYWSKGGSMSLLQKYRGILSQIMPAGAAGVSLLLGSIAPGDARLHPAASQPSVAKADVSERLDAIRQAVSDVAPAIEPSEGEQQLAWGNWWRNGGWRNGGWGNWRNGWHNGGWGNWWRNW
jgi:hypothetical protein